MTFESLFDSYDWGPIRDCPGRFVLRNRDNDTSLMITDLIGEDEVVRRFHPESCLDAVLIAIVSDGSALLSYERRDGTQLHTLNTKEGFERKIDQLGISI